MGTTATGVFLTGLEEIKHSRRRQGDLEVREIKYAIQEWRLDSDHEHASCPAALEDLPKQGLLRRLPLDPWGEKYVYVCPAPNANGFDVYSKGPDRVAGTDDDIHVD
jgi:general secretion pathway protein G